MSRLTVMVLLVLGSIVKVGSLRVQPGTEKFVV
jgi:hypothetical protein